MDKEPAQDEEQPTSQQPAQEESQPEQVKMDEKMDSYQPVMSHSKSGKKKLITAAVIIIIILITLWVVKSFFGRSPQSETQIGNQPVPTQVPTSTPFPAPTPKSQLIRSEWSLEVLNGSAVTGAAKKVADKLESLGYKILKTGNADRSDYQLTELFVAKEMKDKQDLLLTDLKKEVKIASVAGELKDSTASARIIIGTQ